MTLIETEFHAAIQAMLQVCPNADRPQDPVPPRLADAITDLGEERDRFRSQRDQWRAVATERQTEIERLRASLAEAGALLEKLALTFTDYGTECRVCHARTGLTKPLQHLPDCTALRVIRTFRP